jgi:putative transposase
VIKAPVRAPNARAHAERWIGTVRRECLNRLLILGRRQHQSVLAGYALHYNSHRPTAHSASDPQPSRAKNSITKARRKSSRSIGSAATTDSAA